MNLIGRKASKKIDLLEVSDAKRIQLIKEVKETFKEKMVEAKLWRSLLELENLEIKGDTICVPDGPLKGLTFEASLWKRW